MSNPLGNLSENMPEVGSECIIGWRQWSIQGADLMSMSSHNIIPWDYLKPFKARCEVTLEEHESHDAPFRDCSCGIYAAKTLADLETSGYHLGEVDNHRVVGSVKLWGKIIPHERGYRAQYAYPNLILCTNPLVADLIARNYRCEVIIPEIETPSSQPSHENFTLQNLFVQDGVQLQNFKNVMISWQAPNGQYFQYNGPFDHMSLGRWFSNIIAIVGNSGMNYSGMMSQLQISFS